MKKELFKPSLDDSFKEVEVYDIKKIFLVSFFLGIIPTMALAVSNAKKLKISKKTINAMIVIGIIIVGVRMLAFNMASTNYLLESRENQKLFKILLRGLNITFYFGCYMAIKDKFKKHIELDGKIKPLLKDALIWTAIGIAVEMMLSYKAMISIIQGTL